MPRTAAGSVALALSLLPQHVDERGRPNSHASPQYGGYLISCWVSGSETESKKPLINSRKAEATCLSG